MDISYQKIRAALDNAPEALRDALASIDTDTIIAEIGNEYKLHVDAIEDIHDLTLMMCVGLVPATQFVLEAQKVAHELSQQEFSELIEEINARIFEPIRTYEEKIAAKKREEDEFKKIITKYEDALQPEPATPTESTPQTPVTLSDIKSAVKPTVIDQKKTLAEWKSAHVIKTETQKAVIENYTDAPDPYKEQI